MYETVLVPTDGSDASFRALDHAIEVARPHGAAIHVLYVIDPAVADHAPELSIDRIRDTLDAAGRRATSRLADRIERAELQVVTATREGRPADEILAYVGEADVDLVVMGSSGRAGRDRTLVGSVTERVVRADEVPVLTVPSGK